MVQHVPVPFVDTPLTSNVREAVERDWSTNLNGPAVRLYGGEESAAFRVGDVGRRLGPARAPGACCARGVPRSPWPWRWQLIGTSRWCPVADLSRCGSLLRRARASGASSQSAARSAPRRSAAEPPDLGMAQFAGADEARRGDLLPDPRRMSPCRSDDGDTRRDICELLRGPRLYCGSVLGGRWSRRSHSTPNLRLTLAKEQLLFHLMSCRFSSSTWRAGQERIVSSLAALAHRCVVMRCARPSLALVTRLEYRASVFMICGTPARLWQLRQAQLPRI